MALSTPPSPDPCSDRPAVIAQPFASLDATPAIAADPTSPILGRPDTGIAADIQAVIAPIAASHDDPTAYGLGARFKRLVADWRPHRLAPNAQ